jgi:hypothetical protein
MSLTITSTITSSNGLTTGTTFVDLSVNTDDIQNGKIAYTLKCYKSKDHKEKSYDAFTPVIVGDNGAITEKVQRVELTLTPEQVLNFNLQMAHELIHDYLEDKYSWQVTINPFQ